MLPRGDCRQRFAMGVTMKKVMPCVVALLLACSLSAQAAQKREQSYRIGADVDATGHVTATQLDPDVPASIAPVLVSAVKQWQFVPASRNGQAVSAHTFIYTKFQALPDAKGRYSLRISFEGNGPKMEYRNIRPQYPRNGVRLEESAFVKLTATVQPDGTLADMDVGSQFDNWPVPSYFKDAVLACAKKWHGVPEQVGGQPVATRVSITVNFTSPNFRLTSAQVRILREALRKEAADDGASPSDVPMPSEQEVALNSPLQPRIVATIVNAP